MTVPRFLPVILIASSIGASACLPLSNPTSKVQVSSTHGVLASSGDSGALSGGSSSGDPTGSHRGTLQDRVLDLEERLEKDFRVAGKGGGVPNHIETAPGNGPDRPVEVNGGDSALFTGLYLASQCLKFSVVSNPYQREAAFTRVEDLMGVMENYLKVTGVRGLIARQIYKIGSPDIPDPTRDAQGNPRGCFGELPWSPGGPGFQGYQWCGLTSRDQYHGFLLGLRMCQELVPHGDVQVRSARMIHEIVSAMEENRWIVPYGPWEHIWRPVNSRSIEGDTRLSFAKMGLDANVFLSQLPATATGIDPTVLAAAQIRLRSAVDDGYAKTPLTLLYNQQWTHDYVEYYGYNLNSLALYPLVRFESDPDRKRLAGELFWSNLWQNVWTHQNAQFTFMKISALGRGTTSTLPSGVTKPEEGRAAAEARAAVYELAWADRTNHPFDPGTYAACERNPNVGFVRNFIEKLVVKVPDPDLLKNLEPGGKVPTQLCANPLPLAHRDYYHYHWEGSPFNPPTGQGDSSLHSPGVDTIFAYWLGRSVGSFGSGE